MGCSFPEVTAAMVNNITDADLFENYLTHGTTLTWSDGQIEAATGYPTVTTLTTIGPPNAIRVKAQGGSCNEIIPKSVNMMRRQTRPAFAVISMIIWSMSLGATR